MAIYKISISSNLKNPSLQIGDHAFYQSTTTITSSNVKTADDPIYIGPIVDINANSINVETGLDPAAINGFLMYAKDKRINNDSLNGYYAQVTLRNDDPENASELFALNSEAVESSK